MFFINFFGCVKIFFWFFWTKAKILVLSLLSFDSMVQKGSLSQVLWKKFLEIFSVGLYLFRLRSQSTKCNHKILKKDNEERKIIKTFFSFNFFHKISLQDPHLHDILKVLFLPFMHFFSFLLFPLSSQKYYLFSLIFHSISLNFNSIFRYFFSFSCRKFPHFNFIIFIFVWNNRTNFLRNCRSFSSFFIENFKLNF